MSWGRVEKKAQNTELFVCLFVWGRLIFCVLGSRLPIRRRYTIPPLTQVHATVIILFHSNWGIRILAKASQRNRTSLNDIDPFTTPRKALWSKTKQLPTKIRKCRIISIATQVRVLVEHIFVLLFVLILWRELLGAKRVSFPQCKQNLKPWPNGLASRCKWVRAKRNASWTQVQNLGRLASPFGRVGLKVVTTQMEALQYILMTLRGSVITEELGWNRASLNFG